MELRFARSVINSHIANKYMSEYTGKLDSPNFVEGSVGWRIGADGSVEFGSAIVRGAFRTGTGVDRTDITSSYGIEMYHNDVKRLWINHNNANMNFYDSTGTNCLQVSSVFTKSATVYGYDYATIDSKIISTNPIIGEDGKIEYLEITFENGDFYKVQIYDDTDLTVNSELIVELKLGWKGGLLLPRVYNDYYSISKIVKVPSD